MDCLRNTLAEPQQVNGQAVQVVEEGSERSQVKIGAKIFLNQYSTENLKEALDQLYRVLSVEHLDNLILAYHPTKQSSGGEKQNGTTNGSPAENGEDVHWGSGHATAQADLLAMWRVLEGYAKEKKITQLGIADLDVNSLKELFEAAAVRPAIAQINLQACCVVPPSLQEFCNQNVIQLLTHSDPEGEIKKQLLILGQPKLVTLLSSIKLF